jgi:hypothetical protein
MTPQPSTPIKHAGSEYLPIIPPEYKRQIKGMKTSRIIEDYWGEGIGKDGYWEEGSNNENRIGKDCRGEEG